MLVAFSSAMVFALALVFVSRTMVPALLCVLDLWAGRVLLRRVRPDAVTPGT